MSDLSITVPGITVTADSVIMPESLTLEQWSELFRQITHAGNSLQWFVGDVAAFGLQHFPDSVKRFCEIHGLDYGTIRNRAYVSKSVPPERRRKKLAYAYHAEVAQLKLFSDQDKWLTKAETDGMSATELRQAIRIAEGDEVSAESDGKEVRFVSKYCDALADWLTHRPSDFFKDDTRRAVWKERLRPFAEAFNKL